MQGEEERWGGGRAEAILHFPPNGSLDMNIHSQSDRFVSRSQAELKDKAVRVWCGESAFFGKVSIKAPTY